MRATTWPMVLLAACTPIGGTNTGPSSLTTPGSTVVTPPVPAVVEDRILQDRPLMLDVLFVVQTTAGMAEAQESLTANFPIFMDYFLDSGLDYHVGVVTADLDDPAQSGKLVGSGGLRWIDSDTPNPIAVFDEMASLGEGGSPDVQPLGAVYAALELQRDLHNAGFYRADAALRVIVVGDGADATDPANLDPAGFAPWFDALKADLDDGTLSCLLASGAVGTDCADASIAVGTDLGVSLDDTQRALETLGIASVGLIRDFGLTQIPVAGTIEVSVEDVSGAVLAFEEAVPDAAGVLQGDWTYDPVENSVAFLEYVPSWDSEVIITYEAAP